MYEYAPRGLGWETLYQTTWYGARSETPKPCWGLVHRGVSAEEAQQRCFKDTTAERALAVESECAPFGFGCRADGDVGNIWCCPPGQPGHQLPAGEVIPGEPEVTQVPEPDREPPVVHQHTLMTRLAHPGAMAAFGVAALVGYLAYRHYKAAETRRFEYV
jgi:hypothetical protein